MRPGSSANLMYLIFAFGDALHMSSFRRTSRNLFNLIWRNVFSWVIQVDTKVGCSTIPTHRSTSSLNVQSLMNASFLACPSTRQHHQLILHYLTLFLSQLAQHCWNYHLVILLTTRAASTSIQLLPFPKSPSLSSICYALSSFSYVCLVIA